MNRLMAVPPSRAKHLMAHEGIDDRLFRAFLVYLVSHPRPCHEVLFPRLKDIRATYEHEFAGSTIEPVSFEDLLDA